MSINSEIRKIAKAWGVDTKGSSIKDALKDLRTNLPFGTKIEMVEILPMQSVTAEYTDEGGYCQYSSDFTFNEWHLNPDCEYTVVINGKEHKVIAVDDEGYGASLGDGENPPFFIKCEYGEDTLNMSWAAAEYGETITLAIYEEKEVIQPLDAKFVGPVVFYNNGGDDYLYKDEECTQKVSYSELEKVMYNHIVHPYTNEHETTIVSSYFVRLSKNAGVGEVIFNTGLNDFSLYTEEYTGGDIGPA